MEKRIVPSVIANNQKEFNERILGLRRYFSLFQLDVMDEKFVKSKSLLFNFKIISGVRYEAHLMLKKPFLWVKKNIKKVDLIILHIESEDIEKTIRYIKEERSKVKVGLAVNPQTPIKRLKNFVSSFEIEQIVIMSVNPGKYGAKFLEHSIKRVKETRKLFPKIIIEVDGGINDKTIKRFAKYEVNKFVVGSFLKRSKNLKESIIKLKKEGGIKR